MAGKIVELTDEALILPVLGQDTRWASYALCDLDAPHRAYARYLAPAESAPEGIVLIYSPPGFTSLLPCGDSRAVWTILEGAGDLPSRVTVLSRKEDLTAVQLRYRLENGWTMLRMAVAPGELRPAPPPHDADLVRLTFEDLPAIQALYAYWPESVFTPLMLEYGVYFGASVAGELVAIAGTHAMSVRYRTGTIGNVFTRSDYRGRGLAAATTGAVARTLFEAGAREVVLNVREENSSAIAAYRRLGFVLHLSFWEGAATLR
jgi:RimJ/RimL family protein N-acetyltransferase